MQNLFQQSLQIPQMRRFHGVFHKDAIFSLTKTRCISCTRFISSNSSQKHRLFRHFLLPDPRTIHSSSRFSYEEQTNPDFERPRVWTGSDSWAGEFVPSYADLRNSLQEEKSSSEDETPKFSSGSATGTGAERFTAKTAGQRETKLEQEEPSSKDRNPRSENYGVSSGLDSKAQWSASKKKMSKSKIHWVCNNCGESFGQWWGSCRHCGEMNTLKQFVETEKAENKARGSDVSEKIVRSWLPQRPGELRPQRLTEINKGINQMAWRIPLSGLFGSEVSRVLGGGVVPGSLVLVGGDPGVGKSTLLLQVAAMLAEGSNSAEPAPVIYVSGEESVEQIGNRADRMRVGTDELFLYSSTDIEDILEKIQVLSPRALVVDSIQTVYLKSALGSAGSITQVKECTSALLHFAKQTKIPVFLIGHVTKTGDIAGPRVLEHIVDAVLYMEGERYSSHRLLRSVKNRFGSTDELGVFEMSELGLQAVSNPSEIFLTESYSGSEVLAGIAVAVIIDGSRSFLIEIQALCSSSSTIGRHFNGVPANRAEMIIAVLVKQAGLKLQDNAIFLNVVSGFMLKETAGDLAIAAAICSSFLEFPIPNDVAFIGEVGLGGELRTVPRLEKRVAALSKLGYRKCIIPTAAEKSLKARDMGTLAIIGCRNLKEVINKVFVEE